VVAKGNLGRLYVDTVKDIDVATRYNYQKGDYRNYRDGDQASAIGEWKTPDGKAGSLRMYAQETTGGEQADFTTLLNDNARVYKGGSWKDRAYWLNPSTRRFLDQNESRDDIGFRCAMIRVGSPAGL
jgi:sulfatase modifying factor 1